MRPVTDGCLVLGSSLPRGGDPYWVAAAALGLKQALPGMVSSIQSFGSFANFHPHIHALVTDGLVERGGQFHLLRAFDTKAIEQHFRKLVLDRLRRAERLSESSQETLLSWIASSSTGRTKASRARSRAHHRLPE